MNQNNNNELGYYDEYPEADPFIDSAVLEAESLAWKDEVSARVVNAVSDYLTFATLKDLLQLLAINFLEWRMNTAKPEPESIAKFASGLQVDDED